MEPSHVSTALVQFLAAGLRLPQRGGQHAVGAEHQSMAVYYPSLQTALGGTAPLSWCFSRTSFMPLPPSCSTGPLTPFGTSWLPWTGEEVSHTHLTPEFPRLYPVY